MTNTTFLTLALIAAFLTGGGALLMRTVTPIDSASVNYTNIEPGFDDVGDDTIIDDTQPWNQDLFIDLPIDDIAQNTSTMSTSTRWRSYWRPFSYDELLAYAAWQRPDGLARVGLQAGHWRNNEVPEELDGLRQNTGAQGGGTTEVAIVLSIAEKTKALLEAQGILVDLLPTTVPPSYSADAFVSIHADGNANTAVFGYKIAPPRRDFPGTSNALAAAIDQAYKKATGLERDENITRRMSGYYAFNWRRYEHAIHPMTPAAIVETGFLTSPADRRIIVNNQDRVAQGIANGIVAFLQDQGLVASP